MSLEASLYSFLAADAGVAALVSTRIYPAIIPQTGLQPCIVYNKQSRDRQQLFCGVDGLLRTTVDIDCYAKIYDDAVGLANAVTAALTNFSGTLGTTRVPKVFLDNELDLQDIEPGLYRQSQTWIFWHREL